jgi:hypothetical protein
MISHSLIVALVSMMFLARSGLSFMLTGAPKTIRRTPGLSKLQLSYQTRDQKDALISRLLSAKDNSKKTFDEIAAHLGVTNVYAAQLFMNQAQLHTNTVPKLKQICPDISEADIA